MALHLFTDDLESPEVPNFVGCVPQMRLSSWFLRPTRLGAVAHHLPACNRCQTVRRRRRQRWNLVRCRSEEEKAHSSPVGALVAKGAEDLGAGHHPGHHLLPDPEPGVGSSQGPHLCISGKTDLLKTAHQRAAARLIQALLLPQSR